MAFSKEENLQYFLQMLELVLNKVLIFCNFFSSLTLEVKKIVSGLHSQRRPSNNSQASPQCDLNVQMSGICLIFTCML